MPKKMPYQEHGDEMRRLRLDPEPRYDAIHFADGWTGRAWYLNQVFLCGPRTDSDHARHPTEAEAIACIKGEWRPGVLSRAERNRRELAGRPAETPPLAPQAAAGTSDRPTAAPVTQGPQRRPRTTSRPVVPPRTGHPAGCKHGWCYCYDSRHASLAEQAAAQGSPPPICRICRTDQFNRTRRDAK